MHQLVALSLLTFWETKPRLSERYGRVRSHVRVFCNWIVEQRSTSRCRYTATHLFPLYEVRRYHDDCIHCPSHRATRPQGQAAADQSLGTSSAFSSRPFVSVFLGRTCLGRWPVIKVADVGGGRTDIGATTTFLTATSSQLSLTTDDYQCWLKL